MSFLNVMIGKDSRQPIAFEICRHSLIRRCSKPIRVLGLEMNQLRKSKLFSRPYRVDSEGQYWDERDGKPFSTEFSFSRFLVPTVAERNNLKGWVLYCDDDFLFMNNVSNLFLEVDDKYACMVVKHKWDSKNVTTKMDGKRQEPYKRKLWSSLILWNLDHPSNQKLTMDDVNRRPGQWLHAFEWLEDYEIGEILPGWNYIPGHSSQDYDAEAIHYSFGGPWLEQHRESYMAEEWLLERDHYNSIYKLRPTELLSV